MKPMNEEDKKDLKELNTLMINMRNLIKTEGWKQFEKTIFAHEQIAYNEMVSSDNDRKGTLATGAYHALRNARYFPQMQVALIRQRIAALTGEEVPDLSDSQREN